MRVLSVILFLLPLLSAAWAEPWMAVVRHASTSSTQGVVPSFSHAQQHLQASGVSLVQELASTRHPFSLWHMNGTQQQINNFRSRTSSIFTLQLSSAPTQRVTHSARVISSAATSSWALDILDSSSGSMDGLYTNTLQGLGSHIYIVDTGITQNATDLVGRVSYDWTAFPGQPYDCHGHGTHVSGSAAGSIFGTAKLAQVHSYRMLDCTGSGSLGDLAAALLAIDNNFQSPAVINLSLEYGGYDPTIDALLQTLISDGVLVFAACGNEGASSCGYPALTTGVVSVGASTSSNTVAYYSNQGPSLDIFGPGSNVLSDWLDGGTALLSGTSMATGVTSGVGALFRAQSPSATPAQIANLMITVSDKGVLDPTTLISGSPNRMLNALNSGPIPGSPPTPSPPTPGPGPAPAPPAASGAGVDNSVLVLVLASALAMFAYCV